MASSAQPHPRIRFLVGFCLLMMGIFVVRLFYMQILQHEKYAELARKDQVKSSEIIARRGEIYAMDGDMPAKIVLNERVYTVFVDPVQVEKPDDIVAAVREVAGGNAVKNITELVRDKPYRYRVVAKNVTQKQAKLLKDKRLSGLGLQQTTRRVYPENKLAAQVLGFVNAAGEGQYGVEEKLNDQLQGKNGLLRSVTDVSGIPLTIGDNNTQIPAKDGKNVVLTIDRNIQSYTESALQKQMQKIDADNGSALVMDPQTGRVLAMANFPTYSPEKYGKVQNPEAFVNATITVPYEPGSVMKTFTVATALDKQVITPESTFNNTDYIRVGDRTITNVHKGELGNISMQTALNWSLNTGMVTIAKRLGNGNEITLGARQTMYSYLHNKFGLGEPTGIELAGEVGGQVISPSHPEGGAVRYSNMSFGQGMNITMLQVASGFSSIVNGGKYYQPTVLAGYVDENGTFHESASPASLRRTMSADASRQAKKMVHDARAIFYGSQDRQGYDIGGKTGTSQTLINGEYVNTQTIGSYLGYGGDTKPRYVIMVQVSGKNKNFEGNLDAMPVFTDISNWMIDYMQLQPKG